MGILEWIFRPRRPSPVPTEPPITYEDLKSLFEYLDRLDPPPCTHTHKETVEFLKGRHLPVEATIAWLKANGGYCDCEVIHNVADKWQDKVGWQPNPEGFDERDLVD